LVDDGLVEKAKIGGSNYFWSFPAKKDRMMQISYEKLLSTIEATKLRVEETKARLVDAKRGREDDDDDDENDNGGGGGRSQKLARLSELASEKTQLEAELQKLKANDPQALADLEKELQFVTHAAHRWTDNIFNAKTYLVKKKGMDKKEANRLLNITDDFDCKVFDFFRSSSLLLWQWLLFGMYAPIVVCLFLLMETLFLRIILFSFFNILNLFFFTFHQ